MFQKTSHFLKYNNAFVFILLAIVLVGGSVFAATDAGQAAIGGRETRVEGVDNTLLLAVDLDKLNLDFKIEKIEQDEKYYYITYTLIDLVKLDNAWQYQLSEKTRKVSKKTRKDLGEYLAEEFKQEYDAKIKKLREEQAKASAAGVEKREEVTEYTGLIGKTLDLAGQIFPGYEPVKKRELPSPDFSVSHQVATEPPGGLKGGRPDNLTSVYNDYVATHPDLFAEPIATSTASTTDSSAPVSGETPLVGDSPLAPSPIEAVPIIQPDIVIPAETD